MKTVKLTIEFQVSEDIKIEEIVEWIDYEVGSCAMIWANNPLAQSDFKDLEDKFHAKTEIQIGNYAISNFF